MSIDITFICCYMWDLTSWAHIWCVSGFVLKTGCYKYFMIPMRLWLNLITNSFFVFLVVFIVLHLYLLLCMFSMCLFETLIWVIGSFCNLSVVINTTRFWFSNLISLATAFFCLHIKVKLRAYYTPYWRLSYYFLSKIWILAPNLHY